MDKNNLNHEEEKLEEQISEAKDLNSENKDLEKLAREYEEAKKEIDLLKEAHLLCLADSENLRKRTTKQVEDAGKFAVGSLVKDLIEILENLYLATDNIKIENMEENTHLSTIYQGVEMTKKTFISLLEKYGVKRIFPEKGDNFDHNIHQAVAQIADENCADNSIISVMRAGYILHDRLLKPAMVVVAKTAQG